MVKIVRLPTLKTVTDFQKVALALGLEIPCDDRMLTGAESPLGKRAEGLSINGRTPGNRWVIQPMEGWDANPDGTPSAEVRRRWQRFGESGAKIVYGGEAMAIRPDARANPNQLIIIPDHRRALSDLRSELIAAHERKFGEATDLVIGFQLTHSGRFCRPNDKKRFEPRVAFRHPLLDERFGVTHDDQVFSDNELDDLVGDFVRAARVAKEAGADFVDVKHCHGYLLHEFLAAHTRPGRYGGSFENRTRLLREIVSGIRADGNPIDVGVRLSAFDFVPFRPDPAQSVAGQIGPGVPVEHAHLLPYRFAFGADPNDPTRPDLTEAFQFATLCRELGVKLLNVSAGSPYYNPHIQRPAAYPPSDGYQPPEDPLVGVARQMTATRAIRRHLDEGTRIRAGLSNLGALPAPDEEGTASSSSSRVIGVEDGRGEVTPSGAVEPFRFLPPAVIGTGYSYLQEYLPLVAQAAVREGWTDFIGLGRMVLSYPWLPAEALEKGALNSRLICRTFSDCTTAPRNGLPSGCYPLDEGYRTRPEAKLLREIKRATSP